MGPVVNFCQNPDFFNQLYDYLLVLDFEATCWNVPRKNSAEIIEFPVVLYDVRNNEIVAEFQQYVTPLENPKLSDFCIELTGIGNSKYQISSYKFFSRYSTISSRWWDSSPGLHTSV